MLAEWVELTKWRIGAACRTGFSSLGGKRGGGYFVVMKLMRPAILALLLVTSVVGSDLAPGRQVAREFTVVRPANASGGAGRTNRIEFLLYLPKEYETDPSTRFPLVLFLHGAGERGTNVNIVATHGPPKQALAGRDFPFILVSPQCPEKKRWENDSLMGLLDHLESTLRVDKHRVYVTGLSMGGYGTWSLAQSFPGRFAAVAPICGGGNASATRASPELMTLGVWAFHGEKDDVVPVMQTKQMVESFKQAGVKDITMTIYPEDKHDSWTDAYNEPEIYNWLLRHRR
jgi:predicted peptidase